MPTDEEILEEARESLASGLSRPLRSRSREGEEIQERSAADSIDAINHLAGRVAGGNPFKNHTRLIPGASS